MFCRLWIWKNRLFIILVHISLIYSECSWRLKANQDPVVQRLFFTNPGLIHLMVMILSLIINEKWKKEKGIKELGLKNLWPSAEYSPHDNYSPLTAHFFFHQGCPQDLIGTDQSLQLTKWQTVWDRVTGITPNPFRLAVSHRSHMC